jgi:hypothetical protein
VLTDLEAATNFKAEAAFVFPTALVADNIVA